MQATLDARSLADQATDVLLEWVVTGRLAPGSTVHEGELTAALGISRTPVREALIRLARDGVVLILPRVGVRIPELDPAEAQALYPVIAALEGLALASADWRTGDGVRPLEACNRRFASARGLRAILRANEQWHAALAAASANPVLIEQLATLRARASRFEYAWFGRDDDRHAAAVADHEAIAACLARGDTATGRDRLARHLLEEVPSPP
ncbi:MAG: GntR family transcriptional regulator [Gemmatimonadales bacterium]